MSANKIKAAAVILAVCISLSAFAFKAEKAESDSSGYKMSDYAVDLEAASTRHTMGSLETQTVSSFITNDGFEKKIENESVEIWFREKTASIHILDKRTGYIWGELSEDKPDNMSKTWSAFANSMCTVEYYDANDKVKQLPLSSDDLNVTYSWSKDGLKCKLNSGQQGIGLEFKMSVSGSSVTFEIADKSISEKSSKKCRIKSVYFMPFLGAVCEDNIPGYVFIPDGSGALMRFAKKFSYSSGFEKRIYGADVAIDNVSEQKDLQANRNNDYMVEAPQVTLPIFGIVHGNGSNAVLSVCENGEEYASVTADPAGYITDYNRAAIRYDYRKMYVYQASKDGNGVNTVPEEKFSINPRQTFYFLNGSSATYSGMAVFYRELLKNRKQLSENTGAAEIPVRLSVIGAEIKDGFFTDTEQVLTTVRQTEAIADEMRKRLDTGNLTLEYYGWKNGGMSKADYRSTKLNRKLGTESSLRELKIKTEENGGTFYLAAAAVMANKDQINISQMASVGISRRENIYENANQKLKYWQEYVIKPGFAKDFIEKFYGKYSDYSLCLSDMGYRLYADYTRGGKYSRTDTKELFSSLAGKSGGRKLALNCVNAYLFKNTDEYFDIPTVSSQYLFETDTVPFLQIVLKGCMNYYGPYINQGFNSRNSLLKHIEYGMYPSFVLMGADNSKLTYTPLEDYFSINYKDWIGTAEEFYSEIRKALRCVEGSEITEHSCIADGVVKVRYSNGTEIYVNYSSEDYISGELNVGSLNWCVRGAAE